MCVPVPSVYAAAAGGGMGIMLAIEKCSGFFGEWEGAKGGGIF